MEMSRLSTSVSCSTILTEWVGRQGASSTFDFCERQLTTVVFPEASGPITKILIFVRLYIYSNYNVQILSLETILQIGRNLSSILVIQSAQYYIINYMKGKKGTPPKENLMLQNKSQTNSVVTHVSQRSYKFMTAPTVKHLNLQIFKINPCNISKTHNHKHCINYHSNKDRRRYGDFYPEMCTYIKQDQKCPEGDNCPYAHSFVEEHYSYQKYKKYFCFHYPYSISDCPYGDFCSYAHSEEECLSTLIHNYEQDQDFYMFYYKTEFCPFNLTKHDPSKCVYAHNWQDYRRKPDHYPYEAIPCFNWKTKDYISLNDYNSGCDRGFNCNMCHGWKQQQYHPAFYKTVKCQLQGCRKGLCPNYHSEKERRIIEQDIISHAFRYVPKNRIVQGVFKSNFARVGFEPKKDKKNQQVLSPVSVIQRAQTPTKENDYKSKTVMSLKKGGGKEETIQWITEKQMIQSEEQDCEDEEINNQVTNTLDL